MAQILLVYHPEDAVYGERLHRELIARLVKSSDLSVVALVPSALADAVSPESLVIVAIGQSLAQSVDVLATGGREIDVFPEIAQVVERGIEVIPVLVGHARAWIPLHALKFIREFSGPHLLQVRDHEFAGDVAELVDCVERALRQFQSATPILESPADRDRDPERDRDEDRDRERKGPASRSADLVEEARKREEEGRRRAAEKQARELIERAKEAMERGDLTGAGALLRLSDSPNDSLEVQRARLEAERQLAAERNRIEFAAARAEAMRHQEEQKRDALERARREEERTRREEAARREAEEREREAAERAEQAAREERRQQAAMERTRLEEEHRRRAEAKHRFEDASPVRLPARRPATEPAAKAEEPVLVWVPDTTLQSPDKAADAPVPAPPRPPSRLSRLAGAVRGIGRWFGSEREEKEIPARRSPAPPPIEADDVNCSVFAPPRASPGEVVLIQVFAHLPSEAGRVMAVAQAFDNRALGRAMRFLEKPVGRGTELTFSLSLPGIPADEPGQSLIWRGSADSVSFIVTIPADHREERLIGTVLVSQDSVPFGHLKFILDVVAQPMVAASTEDSSMRQTWRRYHHAFISYASEDRAEVLKRTQMLKLVKIEFFQDLLSLEPGERWAKALYKNIDKSDVFFLFWSTAAKNSEWVMKEVRYAIERHGGEEFAAPEIIPVIIEGPPPVAPPPELKDLHFNDRFLYFLDGSA